MGYDMSIVNNPKKNLVPAARQRFDDAVKVRDAAFPRGARAERPEFDQLQAEVDAAYTEMNDVNGYFRLNIWGMSTARDELFKVGVMCDASEPEYPRPENYGLVDYPDIAWSDEQNCWADDYGDGSPVEPTGPLLDYLQALKHWRDDPPPGDHVGIPLYKVGSNDGWLVTPGEIKTGLAWADHHHPGWRGNLTDYVGRFVTWMELAAECGGFRVY